MKSNFSRPFGLNNRISTKQYQKKVTETKVEKSKTRHPKNGTFNPMISWVYNNHCVISILHLGIFISKTHRKDLPKKYTMVILQSIEKWDFDDLFLRAIFAQ